MQVTNHGRARLLKTLLAANVAIAIPAAGLAADRVASWNATAVTATAMAGQSAVVSSRALAMTQIAVHDALNTIERRYEPYAFAGDVDGAASADAAVATAARETLVGLIPVGAL